MDDVLRIALEAEAYDGVAPLDEATRLSLRHRPEQTRSWVTQEGFALVVGSELSLVVRPDCRGRGVGTQLLEQALADVPGGGPSAGADGELRAWSHGHQPAAVALAASHGFRAVRELWVMRRPTSLELPGTPALDERLGDVEVRSFRPGDEAEIVRVNAAAFAHHPEQGAMTRDGLAERMAEPWFEPEGLIEAWDRSGATPRLLGFHWTKRHSAESGEVYVVGIDPSAQGRGLGKVLTALGLVHLSDTAEVHLYVESDNAAAVRLYEGLGFTHARADTHVQYARR